MITIYHEEPEGKAQARCSLLHLLHGYHRKIDSSLHLFLMTHVHFSRFIKSTTLLIAPSEDADILILLSCAISGLKSALQGYLKKPFNNSLTALPLPSPKALSISFSCLFTNLSTFFFSFSVIIDSIDCKSFG